MSYPETVKALKRSGKFHAVKYGEGNLAKQDLRSVRTDNPRHETFVILRKKELSNGNVVLVVYIPDADNVVILTFM